jgi:hypothetical protein
MVKLATYGSRAEVMHGTAKMTKGRLQKHQLMYNKRGRIVSRKQHARAKRENRLAKLGYKPKKGQFILMKRQNHSKSHSKRRSKTRRNRKK